MLTPTATGSVVLNELMINPFGSELQGEWIELFHDGPTVNLGGWKVSDQDGHNLSLPSIGFSRTLVLLWIGPPREGALGLNSTMSLLNDSGDDLTLWDASGNPVDYVAYGSGLAVDPPPTGLRWAGNLPPPPEGRTLALHPDGADQDGSEGWAVGSATPGAPNGPSAEGASGSLDVLITEVYYNTFRDDETVALVNRGHSTVDLEGWTIGDLLGSVAFPSNATLEPGQRSTVTANGTAYREDFLSQPDYTFGPGPGTLMVEGRPPLLSNEGDGVMLKDRWGRTVDALWYGRIVPTREGWTGQPALSLSRGQIAARRATAGALVDTNSSSDWDGPEVRTPGQIRRPLQWYPVQGRLRAFAAPDSSEEVFSEAIASARRRIEVNAYEWDGGHLTELLVEALGRGVEVVLHVEAGLDGGPRGEAQLHILVRGCYMARQHNGNGNGGRLRKIGADDVVSPKEVEAMVAAAGSLRDRTFIACLYETGVRRGELTSRRVKDAQPAEDGDGYVIWFGEVKVEGEEHFGSIIEAAGILRQWLEVHPSKGNPEAPLFPSSQTGGFLNQATVWTFVKKAARQAGVTRHFNPHMLRHSRATDLQNLGVPDGQVKAMLGWTPGSAMLSRYSHLTAKNARNAYKKALGREIKEVAIVRPNFDNPSFGAVKPVPQAAVVRKMAPTPRGVDTEGRIFDSKLLMKEAVAEALADVIRSGKLEELLRMTGKVTA